MWRSIGILALLTGLMLHSAPVRAADSDFVLLKAKITAIKGYSVDDVPDDDAVLISHNVDTLVELKVERVLWGKSMPQRTTAVLRMSKFPIRKHVGRYVYLMAYKFDRDEPLDVFRWKYNNEKICITEDDLGTFDMSKADLTRLNASGDIRCGDDEGDDVQVEITDEMLGAPMSVRYNAPDRGTAEFIIRVAQKTAQAIIKGPDQDVEKIMIVGPGKAGDRRVKVIAVRGKIDIGTIPVGLKDSIIIVHQGDRVQPPHGIDFLAASAGRVSYVVGRDGANVWEVRRVGKKIQIGLVTKDGYGPFEDFQVRPENYKYYSPEKYP